MIKLSNKMVINILLNQNLSFSTKTKYKQIQMEKFVLNAPNELAIFYVQAA